jgi:hypothetical protein
LAANERYTTELHATSEALYNDIFGVPSNTELPTEREQKAIVAQTAFEEFLLTSLQREKDGKAPLSLFARLIPSEPELVLTPVGLLEIKSAGTRAANTAANTQDDYPDFAGFYLNIQAPLQLQDYSVSSKCLSRWVMLVPPESLPDDETTDYEAVRLARTDFAKWIDRFRRSCQDCVKDDSRLEHFQQWLQGAGADADAVIALSHHDDDFGLFFDASNRSPAIVPDDIHRAFDYPSVAILAACGTAEPGGSDFVEAFNKKQIKTVIATSTAVAPEMAGRFLSLLMDLLDDPANGPSYSLSQARFQAVRKLSKATDALGIPFGGRALEFILAGNGSLRVCPPKDSPLPAKATN